MWVILFVLERKHGRKNKHFVLVLHFLSIFCFTPHVLTFCAWQAVRKIIVRRTVFRDFSHVEK